MRLKSINLPGKLAISFFLGSMLIATVSALIMLGLAISEETSGFIFPSTEGLKLRYGYPRIVSSMKTNMYEYVTEDESIDIVEQWIREGKSEETFEETILPIMKEDCTKCHNATSTMTEAMPGMPLTQYEEVVALTESGYTWTQMSKQAHTHVFGIAVFLVVLSLLMAYSDFLPWLKILLIAAASIALWIDVLSWWLAKFVLDFVFVIYVSGAIMSGSIMAMSVLVFLDLWTRIPGITVQARGLNRLEGGSIMSEG